MTQQRLAGGLWCRDVLEHLSDYLDGTASRELQRGIATHLRECRACETFGGEFAQVVGAVRQQLSDPCEDTDAMHAKLMAALRRRGEP